MNRPGAEKFKMLQTSSRCLKFGLFGLVPVLGIPCALMALWLAGRARQAEKRYWNAARPFRIIGVICACASLIGWFVVACLIALVAITGSHN